MSDEATPDATPRISGTLALMSPAVAVDALLSAVEELPPDASPRAIASSIVSALSRAAPNASVGACVVHPKTHESFVELSLPEGRPEPSRDPTRLFPTSRSEWIVPIEGMDGSTLHFALDTELADGSRSPEPLLRRASRLLARLLMTAFELEGDGPGSSRLKAQLVQAEKFASFGRVVANVVHELANPLTSIIAYADHLKSGALARGHGNDDLERLDRIGESAQRILSLSRDLISYARPANAEPEPVSVHDVIERALAFCEHELSTRSVAIERQFAPDLPPIRGAAGPLVQVFVNLFTNAAHAMAASGGRLTVQSAAGSDGRTVEIVVSDTGTGMNPAILNRVFEPFFTTKESEQGSGLGLVIVKEIVTAHGAEITVESELGAGTTFTLSFPGYEPPRSTRRPTS